MTKLTRITMLAFWTALGVSLAPATLQGQQGKVALPPLMDEVREVALSLSAGPPQVSRDARVLVLKRGGFVEVREGTNGFTCMVDRYFVEAMEPTCFNPEASQTILPVLLRRNDLREKGLTPREIDQEIEHAYERGEFRLPQGLAFSYMFSAGQDIISDSGARLGAYVPHLMIYVPYVTPEALGGKPERRGDPMVFRAGQRGTAIIVPVMSEFVEPGR